MSAFSRSRSGLKIANKSDLAIAKWFGANYFGMQRMNAKNNADSKIALGVGVANIWIDATVIQKE